MDGKRVPSELPEHGNCKLALIGEAPSNEEVDKGRPFVGPAGRILNAMLRAANIDRRTLFIGNVFDQQLTENSVPVTRKALGEARWKAWYEEQRARLNDELSAFGPNCVVPMGGTALLALAGTPSILKMRGQLLYGDLDPPGTLKPERRFKLLPTYHPAFIMRQWKYYPIGISDLIKAAVEAAKGPEIVFPRRVLHVSPDIEFVEAKLAEWSSAELLSVDIETGWKHIRGVSFAPHAEEALYVPFVSLEQADRHYWRNPQHEVRAWRAVKRILESDVPKLGQNFAHYDVIWLFRRGHIKVKNLRHDTRLLHHALYAELPKSLLFMGAAYSSQGAWKHWGDQGWRKKDRGEKRDE